MKVLVALWWMWLMCARTLSFPFGAPDAVAVCQDLNPYAHPPSEAPNDSYLVNLSVNVLQSDGSLISVTLSRTDGQTFRGYIIQARDVTDNSTLGAFDTATDNDVRQACRENGGSSVTHTRATDKVNVTIPWIAPSGFLGSVQFWCTMVVVNNGSSSIYWKNIPSQKVAVNTTGQSTGTDEPDSTDSIVSTTVMPTPPPIDTKSCGDTKGCYRVPSDCPSEGCQHLLTWQVFDSDKIRFEISALVTTIASWTAVGFSYDEEMGDDSVVDCIYDGSTGNIVVQSSFNRLQTNEVLLNPSLGLVPGSLQGSFADGVLHCLFERYMTVTNTTVVPAADEGKVFDLRQQEYFLFLPVGLTIGSQKTQHSSIPAISPGKVDLSSEDYINIGGTNKNALISAHGSLMVIAWMMFASCAILMPRYFKPAWPDRKCTGKQIWFMIHMPTMASVLIITVISVIIIFIEAEGYAKELTGSSAAHPIIGLIVVALVIINPIMALFRPHPGTPNRWIFNWCHLAVGQSAHILSAVELILGVLIDKVNAQNWCLWCVVSYICWHAVVECTLSVHKYLILPNTNKASSEPETHATNKTKGNENDTYESLTTTGQEAHNIHTFNNLTYTESTNDDPATGGKSDTAADTDKHPTHVNVHTTANKPVVSTTVVDSTSTAGRKTQADVFRTTVLCLHVAVVVGLAVGTVVGICV